VRALNSRAQSSWYRWRVLAPAMLAMITHALPAHASEIVVGQVAPLSGIDANQGRAYLAGLQIYFHHVNKIGGIGGNTFTLVSKDDGGRAEDTLLATRKLLAEVKPTVLSGFAGGKNLANLVSSGLLDKEGIALVGYRTGEIAPDARFLYTVRAGLREEIDKIAEHLSTVGINRLALFYEDGPRANALLMAMDEVSRRTGSNVLAKSSYAAGTTVVNAAVEATLAARPQAVLMVASGSATASFVEQYRARGGKAQLFSHSGADIEQIRKRLSDEQMQGVVVAQVTPSPYRITGRLSSDFAEVLAKSQAIDVPASYAMMEGFIAAKVIVEASRRMGPRVSREGFIRALESIESFDLGGYVLGYRSKMKSSGYVELSIVTSGRIRQ